MRDPDRWRHCRGFLAPAVAAVAATIAGADYGRESGSTGYYHHTVDQPVVVTAPDASPGELFAAREMSLLVGNMSNGHIPLPIFNVSDVPTSAAIRLAVGYSASTLLGVPKAKLQGLGRDGFRIAVPGGPGNALPSGCVAVSGGWSDPRGTLYGVYALVESMGFEFVAWDLTVLPPGAPSAPVVLPTADIVDRPSFVYRDVSEWPVYSNRVFARHMRFNNAAWLECVEDTANPACFGEQMWDSFKWASPPGMAHTIYHLLCANATSMDPHGYCKDPLKPPQDLIKSRPEWFWPHGDANTYGQVCYHNASLVEFLTRQVRSMLRAQPDAPWLSITQNDNMNDCMDPEELAILHEEGGARAGNQLRAINAVADAIRDEFPDVLIDTFAYEQTARAPLKTKPLSNVIVRVATTWCNFAAPINGSSDVNSATRKAVETWGNISEHLSVWDYTANYDNPTIPYPDWFKWGDTLKFEHEHGVIGYYGEGLAYELPGRDLVELVIYLQSKLLWNVGRNSTELIDHFLTSYYGAAAPHIYKYMRAMLDSMHTVGMCRATGGDGGEGYPASAAFLTPMAVLSGARAFADARTAVLNSPAELGRVDRGKLGLYFVILLRWEEMRSHAEHTGQLWPLEDTVDAAFQEYSRVANDTASVLRCFFAENYPDPEEGRCLPGPFGSPKGATTASGTTPYLTWLRQQINNKSATAWCQPGYNEGASPACWQNCSQEFRCGVDGAGGTCDSAAYCRGETPHPPLLARYRSTRRMKTEDEEQKEEHTVVSRQLMLRSYSISLEAVTSGLT